jgi:hypothetical protein
MTSPTVVNPGTYTQGQSYSTGYAPIYDGNGNLISNGAIQNTNPNNIVNAPAPGATAPAPAPAPDAPTPVKDK